MSDNKGPSDPSREARSPDSKYSDQHSRGCPSLAIPRPARISDSAIGFAKRRSDRLPITDKTTQQPCAATAARISRDYPRRPNPTDRGVERDGFELPRPFRIRWKEFSRVWGTMRLPKKAAVLKRIYQPGFGSSLQISVVSLVRYARARSWVMSNVRRTFRVSNSHRLSGQIANEDPSPYLAHSPTFLLFLRQGAIPTLRPEVRR
jgi:hypothetical protein